MGKYMTEADWKHSPYFKKEEFRCPCGKCNGYPTNGIYKSLVDNMNFLRHYFGKSITITSGYRCEYGNKLVGGDKNSAHLLGGACDWNFTNTTFTEAEKGTIIYMIKRMPNYHYSYSNQTNMYNAIHIDTNLVDCATWDIPNVDILHKEIKTLNDKVAELTKDIEDKEVEIEKLQNINESLVDTNDLYKTEIDKLNKELKVLINKLQEATNEYTVLFKIFDFYVCKKNKDE